MKLQKAQFLANRVVEILQPHCQVVNIAGSIRREKPIVKDIEIVAIPKKIFVSTDLFGGGYHTPQAFFVNAIGTFTDEVIKGQPNGRYMQILLKGGCATLDLFMPTEEDYYRQLAIRTGSSQYSSKVIASAWVKKGWCGSDKGLRRIIDCEAKITGEKTRWHCINPDGEKPPVWHSEEAFFKWLGIEYIHPMYRDVNTSFLAK